MFTTYLEKVPWGYSPAKWGEKTKPEEDLGEGSQRHKRPVGRSVGPGPPAQHGDHSSKHSTGQAEAAKRVELQHSITHADTKLYVRWQMKLILPWWPLCNTDVKAVCYTPEANTVFYVNCILIKQAGGTEEEDLKGIQNTQFNVEPWKSAPGWRCTAEVKHNWSRLQSEMRRLQEKWFLGNTLY